MDNKTRHIETLREGAVQTSHVFGSRVPYPKIFRLQVSMYDKRGERRLDSAEFLKDFCQIGREARQAKARQSQETTREIQVIFGSSRCRGIFCSELLTYKDMGEGGGVTMGLAIVTLFSPRARSSREVKNAIVFAPRVAHETAMEYVDKAVEGRSLDKGLYRPHVTPQRSDGRRAQ